MPDGWDLPGFSAWLGGRAAATRKAYVSDVSAFAEWMSRSDIEGPTGVDRIHLRRYLASLGTRKLARATIARKAAALRCYFSWQVRQGHLGADPARSLRAPSGGGRLPRVLSSGEVGALLDAPAETALDRRDLAVLELLYAAGLRVSELCGLDRGDIDLRGRTVTVLGKGGSSAGCRCTTPRSRPSGRGSRKGGTRWRARPEAAFVNRRGARLGRGTCGASSTGAPPPRPTPMPCATPTPPTCSTAAPTWRVVQGSWATPAWPRRRSTPTSARSACVPSTARRTPGPEPSRPWWPASG